MLSAHGGTWQANAFLADSHAFFFKCREFMYCKDMLQLAMIYRNYCTEKNSSNTQTTLIYFKKEKYGEMGGGENTN